MLNDSTTLTPKEIAQIDCAYWADTYKIKLQGAVFSFRDHPYEIEPLQSTARRMCAMKATQGGWTEMYVLRSLHGMIHKKYPKGVLYLFPTTDDVREFSKSRFNPLIEANREIIGKYVKTGGKGTDTASLKKIHEAFLYLRGARLTQTIDEGVGEKEALKLRNIPVDCVIFDEWDLMDQVVGEKAKGRMGHSKVKEEVYLSNPTIPGYGIDATFQKSDQRHLFRKCSCGEWSCAELTFPECVRVKDDGTGYIACLKCGSSLDMSRIEWVPSIRDNTEYMHGYRWSQLSSVNNDPAEILTAFNDPPEGNLGDVYRLRLGMPYVAAEDKLSSAVVRECCTSRVMPTSHLGQCAMGVDVGKIKHIVIGTRTGIDRYEIVKVIRLSSWDDIHDLALRFNVKSAVIDIRPYEDEARRFQKAEPYKIFLCQYNENTANPKSYNQKTGIVSVNRTEIFDTTHRLFTEQETILPRRCSEVDEFVLQICAPAKVLETNKKTGNSVYRYRNVGSHGDHYRNATNYFYLAASTGRIASVNRYRGQTKVLDNYAVI